MDPGLKPELRRYNLYLQRYSASVFALSIAIAYFSPAAARWSWRLLLLSKQVVPRLAAGKAKDDG